MKKLKKMFAVMLLLMSFMNIETQSKTLKIEDTLMAAPYCAGTYNSCGYMYYCTDDVEGWLTIWEFSDWWCTTFE